MSARPPRRRRGGLVVATLVDLVRDARYSRNWAILLVIILVGATLLVGGAGQAAVPFVIYGGL